MSTAFAPVAPLAIARQLAKADPEAFGNYHLLIATEVLKDPIGHNKFWIPRDDIIILDNGVIEKGEAVDLRLLAAAAVLVGADIVVVPDVIADAQATIDHSNHAMKLKGLLPRGTELMGVAQARTPQEAIDCQKAFDRNHIEWIAVPKGYAERKVGKRSAMAKTIHASHILGFSNNDWKDDILAARVAGGIDSALPIWLAAERILLRDGLNMKLRRPDDYWDWQELNPDQLELAIMNIKDVRSILNEGH